MSKNAEFSLLLRRDADKSQLDKNAFGGREVVFFPDCCTLSVPRPASACRYITDLYKGQAGGLHYIGISDISAYQSATYQRFYVPSCQLAKYFFCAGVKTSIFTPSDESFSRETFSSISLGTS